jgi:ribose transport system ATP-binding protein
VQQPALSVRNLTKSFAGRVVLDSVDIDVHRGEVHGLVGQNGSGKSTLVKILSGFHAPDRGGELHVDGTQISLPVNSAEAHLHGLAFVHQDLALAPTMTVMENLRLGRYETSAAWRILWREERRHVRAALKGFGLDVAPDARVSSLREVERAMVAILRALEQLQDCDRGVLVLDEPTAYLPRDGVEQLFDAVRVVTARGFGVLLVTHRLEEIRGYTDRVTVLRNGQRVATLDTPSVTADGLVELIVGRSFDEFYPPAHTVQRDVALRVADLQGEGLSTPFSLDVSRGEVVGLTGLAGMGYERPLYLLGGADAPSGGRVAVVGTEVDARTMTPRRALGLGLALLTADRLRTGAVATATVAENVTLPTLRKYFRRGILRHRSQGQHVAELMERFQVAPPMPGFRFGTLSGGNQQKALMAKWFATSPKVLLLHEPTQGVDVGARRQLFQYIRDLADSGTAVLMASTEYGDLARLCDRVLVFRNGAAQTEIGGESLSEERIVQQSLVTTTPAGVTSGARG